MGVLLALLLVLSVVAGGAPADRRGAVDPPARWSDPDTWGGAVPVEGEVVHIPRGETVLLDVSPPALGGLEVDGGLIFDERDLRLMTEWIVVRGRLEVGTADAPFRDNAAIVLVDRVPGEDVLGFGDRVIAVAGGVLDLHGEVRGPSWTRLAATAEAGDDRLLLERPVGWDVGDRAEFTRMGQRGEEARYPIHFHMLGDAPESYVRFSSIHHTFNRCLTIHGTNRVRIEWNVAYDAVGHCYFLEDGAETGNVLGGNLGLLTRAPAGEDALLASDLTPATFWITNPDNVLRGNVAAGSEAFGFWYALPEHPTGHSASPRNDERVWPRRTPLGEFRDNVAHSNNFRGLNVDDGPLPDGTTELFSYDPRQEPIPGDGDMDSDPVIADFTGFTGYKNRERGVWLNGINALMTGAVLADNGIGVTYVGQDSFIKDSLIVGESANRGEPGPLLPNGRDGRSLPPRQLCRGDRLARRLEPGLHRRRARGPRRRRVGRLL